MNDGNFKTKIIYFNKENAAFYKTDNGFAGMKAYLPPVELLDDDFSFDNGNMPFGPHDDISPRDFIDYDGEYSWQDLGRVYFHRAFPFDMPDSYISVMDRNSNEYGIIKDINDFDDETKDIIRSSLDRKYYVPSIQKIDEIKDKFGYSYWTVIIDGEKRDFSVKDTFKSIIKISNTKLLIMDCDGNRFLIPDINELDGKSYRKIELYL